MRTISKGLGAGVFLIVVATMGSRPSLATRGMQGAVAEVPPDDAAAMGTVGFRIWSARPGGTTDVNAFTTSCKNLRCLRSYTSNSLLDPGGYIGNRESTSAYIGGSADQPFYMLVDASMNDANPNHVGFFGIAGVTVNETSAGNFLTATCGGSAAQACVPRLDGSLAAPPLTGTVVTFGGPSHTIRAIGGLNPIPNVNITSATWQFASLSWRNPPDYAAAMRPSSTAPAPPSPVKGVRLWKNERRCDCIEPSADDPRWTPVGTFDLGMTTTTVPLAPEVECTFFALTVRFIGPGDGNSEIETFRVGTNSQPVGGVRIPEAPPPCEDYNPCTTEQCDSAANECVYEPLDGCCCDDYNGCTSEDHCSAGACVGTPAPSPLEIDDSLRVQQLSGTTTIQHSDSPGPYSFYRGGLCPGSPWTYNHECLGRSSDPSMTDPLTPFPGCTFWYLATRAGSCGESIPGRDSDGNPIPSAPPCP